MLQHAICTEPFYRHRRRNRLRSKSLLALTLCGLAVVTVIADRARSAEPEKQGDVTYRQQCARCHGKQGEGVKDACEDPLIGSHSIDELAQIIDETMPEDDPEKCTGADARGVAAYIHGAFYSEAARGKAAPSRVALSRLTVRQYEESMADLFATFWGSAKPLTGDGLLARYYNDRGFRRDKLVLERTDGNVDFDFGESSPLAEKIGKEAYAIQWQGSILAEDTGDYEFIMNTANGARLWINDADEPLIDAWVKSGDQTEHHATIRLLGGRSYYLRLDYSKFKAKTGSIRLSWQPPHRAVAVIPRRNLARTTSPRLFVVNTPFPPDDSSVGYERGSTVSKAWDEAATYAALEAANLAATHVDSLAHCKPDAPDRAQRAREFCRRFAARAFRRPLTPDQQQRYVDRFFDTESSLALAVKQSVLLTLSSPRFLYPEIGPSQPDGYTVAARLSYGLWDSLPDTALLKAAQSGQLKTGQQIAQQANRMLEDRRARNKVRVFLHQWLKFDRAEDLSKDKQLYPEFDAAIAGDLRTSVDLFLDDVVWSPRSDFRDLLLADTMFLNRRLADYYGQSIDHGPPEDGGAQDGPAEGGAAADGSATDDHADSGLTDDDFVKIHCDSRQRAGVLTHPFLMAAFAYHKSSSPIHRGVFIVRSLVGRSLKPPPIAVAPLDAGAQPDLTTRQRVALQTRPAACQTCHSLINPLGFTLENYDAVGRFRTKEGARPVDSSGSYKTLEGDLTSFRGARQLATFLADSQEVHRSIVAQLFHFTVKQPITAYGDETLDELVTAFRTSKFSIRQLLIEIVKRSAEQAGVSPKGDVT